MTKSDWYENIHPLFDPSAAGYRSRHLKRQKEVEITEWFGKIAKRLHHI